MPELVHHTHGKKRVRVARTWREGSVHHFVEWNVEVVIESAMAHAYTTHSNDGMTTTDTTKNQCYVVAKAMKTRCSPEDYALALGTQFVDSYPLISACEVRVEQAPWQRTKVMGSDHDHGYTFTAPATRTCVAVVSRTKPPVVRSGMRNLKVLKTTQSGYEGFLVDKHTALKDTRERILATAVDVDWTWSKKPKCYGGAYRQVYEALTEMFFGNPNTGVYSPSVQYTLYQMGTAAVTRVDGLEQITLTAPNLHFVPANPPGVGPFADDVYVATSEPHGQITCTVSAKRGFTPLAKL
jgi:urate oxidase